MISNIYSILIGIDVLLAIGVVVLVLLQHGKGADAGAAFGSGASSTIFGAQGSTSFLSKMTGLLAALFFINSLALAYLAAHRPLSDSVVDSLETQQVTQQAPVGETEQPDSQGIMREDDQAADDAAGDIPDGAGDIPIEDNSGSGRSDQAGDSQLDIPVDDIPDTF